MTFKTSMKINLGACEIQLIHLAGHTPGDTVVWIPKEKILVAGDLLIAPVPYGGYDQFIEWIASLDKLITFKASAIVPGHGPVEFTQDYMAQERDLFRALMDQAVIAVNQGRSLDEFKKTLDLSTFEAKFVHGDPELQWDGITTSTARTANLPPGLTARRLALCKHERKGISFASQRRDQPGSRQIVSPG